jgi:hypothetical protein
MVPKLAVALLLIVLGNSLCYTFTCGEMGDSDVCATVDSSTRKVTVNEDGCDDDKFCYVSMISQEVNDWNQPKTSYDC